MTQSPLTEPKKLWNIPYILVLTVSTLSSFSFYMVATILSKYLVGLSEKSKDPLEKLMGDCLLYTSRCV